MTAPTLRLTQETISDNRYRARLRLEGDGMPQEVDDDNQSRPHQGIEQHIPAQFNKPYTQLAKKPKGKVVLSFICQHPWDYVIF